MTWDGIEQGMGAAQSLGFIAKLADQCQQSHPHCKAPPVTPQRPTVTTNPAAAHPPPFLSQDSGSLWRVGTASPLTPRSHQGLPWAPTATSDQETGAPLGGSSQPQKQGLQ